MVRAEVTSPLQEHTSPLLTVTVINLLLAIVVLFKDLRLAALLGTSLEADAFFLAFFIPDAIGNNVLGMCLSTACVPALVRLREASNLLQQVMRSYVLPVVGTCLLVAGGLWVIRSPLLGVLATGAGSRLWQLTQSLFPWMLLLVVIQPLTALASSYLQAHDRFSLATLAPVIFNALWLLSIVVLASLDFTPRTEVHSLAVTVPIAALLTLIVMIVGIYRQQPTRTEQSWAIESNLRKSSGKDLLPMLLVALSMQFTLMGERFWASNQGEGAVAALNYAYRLAQFPLWTFIAALAMVVLPALTRAAAKGLTRQVTQLAADSMTLTLLLTIPAGMALSMLAKPIVTLLMYSGSFDASSATITSSILQGYALALPFLAVVLLGHRFLLVRGLMKLPALSCVCSSIITIALDGVLVRWFGPAGLGYGATIGALLNAIITMWLLHLAGIEIVALLKSQLLRIMAAHLPLAGVLALSARTWVLVADLGVLAWCLFAFCTALTAIITWLAGLNSCSLLRPISSLVRLDRMNRIA